MKRTMIAAALILVPLAAGAGEMSSLIAAIEGDDAATVARFIASGGDIDAFTPDGRFGGSPLLHLAARVNATESATLLIEAGARLNARSRTSGATALHAAALRGNTVLIERLVKGGANPNTSNKFGDVPLHNAVAFGHHQAVETLLHHGADPNLTHGEQGPAIMATARMADPAVRRALGLSPDPDPAEQIVRKLIAHGADIHVADSHGTTLLDHWMHRVCTEHDPAGTDVVELLLDTGALLDKDRLRGFLDIGRTLGSAACATLEPLIDQQQL